MTGVLNCMPNYSEHTRPNERLLTSNVALRRRSFKGSPGAHHFRQTSQRTMRAKQRPWSVWKPNILWSYSAKNTQTQNPSGPLAAHCWAAFQRVGGRQRHLCFTCSTDLSSWDDWLLAVPLLLQSVNRLLWLVNMSNSAAPLQITAGCLLQNGFRGNRWLLFCLPELLVANYRENTGHFKHSGSV